MVTTTTISEILFDKCDWGVERYIANNMPFSEITEERVVVITHEISPDTYWNHCYVDINWCIPDLVNEADSIRLGEVERIMTSDISYGTGYYENKPYKYKRVSVSQERDEQMRCHYVNVRLMFHILNIM